MRLSYSAISTYQKCPLAYKFTYIDKLPTKPSHHISFGISIHSALEFFYNPEKTKPCSLEELLDKFEKVWISEGYENEQHELENKEKGRNILIRFYQENVLTYLPPLAVEKKFAIDLDGVTISGVIDRIDQLSSGGLEIIDYKTNAKVPPQMKLSTDLQLPIYHMAVENIYGIAPDKVTLYFLIPSQKLSTKKSKYEIEKAKKTILTVADYISKELFEPKKNPLCPWCDFIEICPVSKNDPAILAKAAANGKLNNTLDNNHSKNNKEGQNKSVSSDVITEGKQIEAIVDEYLDLVKDIKEKRERLNLLQKQIHDYCEKNGLCSISGSRGQIARKAKRTTHFNVEKLRELLEPRGLWEKILDINSELLKKLLQDKEIYGEISKLVEMAKEMEEISYYLYIKDEEDI